MHRLARNDAGRLHVDARAFFGLYRPLAIDWIAESVDDATEQPLADGHVDDRAGALDGLAFLDLAVAAEKDDTDIVGLEIQHHPAYTGLELHQLAGLHIVETVDARNAVADGKYLADL